MSTLLGQLFQYSTPFGYIMLVNKNTTLSTWFPNIHNRMQWLCYKLLKAPPTFGKWLKPANQRFVVTSKRTSLRIWFRKFAPFTYVDFWPWLLGGWRLLSFRSSDFDLVLDELIAFYRLPAAVFQRQVASRSVDRRSVAAKANKPRRICDWLQLSEVIRRHEFAKNAQYSGARMLK